MNATISAVANDAADDMSALPPPPPPSPSASLPAAAPAVTPAPPPAAAPPGFVRIPPTATHYRVRRRLADGSWEQQAAPMDDDASSGYEVLEWPIEECSLERISDRHGVGMYQLTWITHVEGQGIRRQGQSPTFVVAPKKIDPVTPRPVPVPSPAAAVVPSPASPSPSPAFVAAAPAPSMPDPLALYKFVQSEARAERELSITRDREFLAAMARGPAPSLDVERLAHVVAESVAQSMSAAIAPLADALAAREEEEEEEEDDDDDVTAPAAAAAPPPAPPPVVVEAPPIDVMASASKFVDSLRGLFSTVAEAAPVVLAAVKAVKGTGGGGEAP